MKSKTLVILTAFAFALLIPTAALHAQPFSKAKNLCKTWMIGTMEIQMHFPYDTTVVIYSRAAKIDTLGVSIIRMKFEEGNKYQGISKKGVLSTGTWELSKDESKLTIRRVKQKTTEYTILRFYPNYMELCIKKFGTKTVLKMVPE